jgi:hypothetical protein
MTTKSGGLKEFVPLLTKLVWPIFIIIMLFIFMDEIQEFYSIAKKRIVGGASIKIAGFLELGQQAGATEITNLSLSNIPIEAIGGAANTAEKESLNALVKLREDLRKSPNKRVDTLKIDDTKKYSPTLLKDYVSTLGMRYILFQHGGKFDGWIESGIFISQLPLLFPGAPPDELDKAILNYNKIREEIAGISTQFVKSTDTAKKVLAKMQELHVDNLPILKGDQFLFFANRGEILSSLISSLIIEQKGKGESESENQ